MRKNVRKKEGRREEGKKIEGTWQLLAEGRFQLLKLLDPLTDTVSGINTLKFSCSYSGNTNSSLSS